MFSRTKICLSLDFVTINELLQDNVEHDATFADEKIGAGKKDSNICIPKILYSKTKYVAAHHPVLN